MSGEAAIEVCNVTKRFRLAASAGSLKTAMLDWVRHRPAKLFTALDDVSFTVRRVSYDVGVERIFPLCSPRIAKNEVVRKGKTRRAKLYFLRERAGKSAKLRERLGVVIPASTEVKEAPAKAEAKAE